MSCSTLKTLAASVSSMAVCVMLLVATAGPAYAEKPAEDVIRTFAVISNSPETLPDFLGERSLGMVVAPCNKTQQYTMWFADSNCADRYDFTVWERRDVTHIQQGGAETIGPVVWLLTEETPEPPPAGAITFPGPDSPLILNQELLYYEPYGTGYRFRCSSGGAGVFMVVTAIFFR